VGTTYFSLCLFSLPAHDGLASSPDPSLLPLPVDQMEDILKSTASASLSDIDQLRHRQSVPDVPEDIEDELRRHFNDPNWDFHANSSTASISTDSDGLEPKRWSKSSTYMGASSEIDTEMMQDSKADFSSDTTQVQCALLSRLFSACSLILFTRDSPYPEVRAAVANTDDPDMVVNTFRV
jgi:hypothetical protein